MAAYAALVSLINNVDQNMKHPRLSTSLDNKQIQPLLDKAGFLLAFMEANNYGGGSKEAEDLEREITSAAYAAEDVIESHIVDQIHAGTSEPSVRCSLDLQQKTQDMDAVMKKANEFKGKQGSREEQLTHVARPVMEIGETTAMVGLDADLYQLLDELTGHQSSRHTISISGMGGMGIEMAAYAALVSLINNVDQIMKHPRLSTSLDNKQIQPLLDKAGLLLDFMEANNYGGDSKEAEDLEREIVSAAHAAEDVIESHIVDQIHAGTSETSVRCSLDLQQKTQDMDAVLEKANEFKGKHGSREERPTYSTHVMEIGETTAMVGLDEELKQLVQDLTGDQSSRHTISISGMGGTGGLSG